MKEKENKMTIEEMEQALQEQIAEWEKQEAIENQKHYDNKK